VINYSLKMQLSLIFILFMVETFSAKSDKLFRIDKGKKILEKIASSHHNPLMMYVL
jgi:hypothetical protein